jgi:hypothetical protein
MKAPIPADATPMAADERTYGLAATLGPASMGMNISSSAYRRKSALHRRTSALRKTFAGVTP